ncbi:MAG: hypothetical protein E6J59_02735 [Deltaproteobacteria bacterium]|nr:MAG: hypothetical protein E6J59_02735 [Deltaproteobacteria bacterium]
MANFGRKVRDLAIDPLSPSTLCATLTGLEKTTDRGASSFAINGGLETPRNFAHGAPRHRPDPVNPAVLHTATESLGGFAGDGILKTVDGGGSWGFATSGLPRESEIIRIAVDRSDPSTLYASARAVSSRPATGAKPG